MVMSSTHLESRDLFCELARGSNDEETPIHPQEAPTFANSRVHPAYDVWQDVNSMEPEQLPSLPFNSEQLGERRMGYFYPSPPRTHTLESPEPDHSNPMLTPMPHAGGHGGFAMHQTNGAAGGYAEVYNNYNVPRHPQAQGHVPSSRHHENVWQPEATWLTPGTAPAPGQYR